MYVRHHWRDSLSLNFSTKDVSNECSEVLNEVSVYCTSVAQQVANTRHLGEDDCDLRATEKVSQLGVQRRGVSCVSNRMRHLQDAECDR